MARSYKTHLPGLTDGVFKLETHVGAEGKAATTRAIVIPLEDACRYFARPESLANVLEAARKILVQRWNAQPRGEKFSLEWEEEVCTENDEDPARRAAVVLALNTFSFTNNHQDGQEISPADVQLNIKVRSAGLYQKDSAGGHLDQRGRRSDRHGFVSSCQSFLDMLRHPNFWLKLVDPARKYVRENLTMRRSRAGEEEEEALSSSVVSSLGRNYRVAGGGVGRTAPPPPSRRPSQDLYEEVSGDDDDDAEDDDEGYGSQQPTEPPSTQPMPE
jgi:hypothetical protein